MSVNRHRFCVAPMMGHTDRHGRFLLRRISRRTMLYTEMLTAAAVVHGDAERLLRFSPEERPLALQLGGAAPDAMARSAEIAEAFGYDEININVGCPSDRVQAGRFGACLMAEPELVASCVVAMRSACALPITVKTRTGLGRDNDFAFLLDFVDRIADAGCETVIVHARNAWLNGLSPEENRNVPPLRYDAVYRLKHERPALQVILNGGLTSLDEAARRMTGVDGVMMGRAAVRWPYLLADVDRRFYGSAAPPAGRKAIARSLLTYIEREASAGTPVSTITRHLGGLFHGCAGARAFRRHLAENAWRRGAGPEVLETALGFVGEDGDVQVAA